MPEKNRKKKKGCRSSQSVFSLVNSAVNMTLPAFAAERRAAPRAAAPLLLGACRCRSTYHAHTAGAQQQTRRTPQHAAQHGAQQQMQAVSC